MKDRIEGSFTEPDLWRGGFYEFEIVPRIGSSEQVCALLSALWSFPALDGCYFRDDCDLAQQHRRQPCENGPEGHLYGLATLPDKGQVVCGSYTTSDAGEGTSPPAYWVSFYFPLGALSQIFSVGAYPFGSMNGVPDWRLAIDAFLRTLAEWIFQKVPFDF
jgi:hypothetical protein